MNKCAVLFVAVSSLVVAGRAADLDVSILQNTVLRVRVNLLTEHFTEQLRAAGPTNPVSGMVLDLRFADGSAAPAGAADYFTRNKMPLVILVNSQTRGSAATLAAQLRAAGAGIVIGGANSPGKIPPDVLVSVSAEDEKKFSENPFAPPATNRTALFSTTNLLAFVDHTSEAELVLKRIKDGEEDTGVTTPRAEPAQPVIRDPALARAVDLLKALAALHPAHDL
jgi:hypothetical protein